LLADVSNAIAEEKVSILSGKLTAMKDVTATLVMTIEVSSQNQFDRVMGRIKAIRDIIEVHRGR
jgi:GTP pyrophosphokinase